MFAGALASVIRPEHLELSWLIPLREHPSQSMPHGHRDTNAGPRLIAPAAGTKGYPSN
mgnify:CR=1 FL=1